MTELREHRYLEVLYGFRIQIKSRDWAVCGLAALLRHFEGPPCRFAGPPCGGGAVIFLDLSYGFRIRIK